MSPLQLSLIYEQIVARALLTADFTDETFLVQD